MLLVGGLLCARVEVEETAQQRCHGQEAEERGKIHVETRVVIS